MENLLNVTQEDIESFLGYELNNYDVETLFTDDGEPIGLNIKVEPKRHLHVLQTSMKILPSGKTFAVNIE